MSMLLELEKMVDQKSLVDVLEALTTICEEKEEHVLVNWQDGKLASRWKKAGGILANATNRINNLRI